MNPVRLPLLTAAGSGEDVLEMTGAAVSMDLLEVQKYTMEILREVMSSVYYVCNPDFRDFEDIHESGAKEQVATSSGFLLLDPFRNSRKQI